MKQFLIKVLLLTVLFSCKKGGTPIPEENKQMAAQFEATITQHQYALVAYYSQTAVDYEPTDTVGAKTNHWEYVSYHLKDDNIAFQPGGIVAITQNAHLMPGTTETILNRQWKVVPDQEGVRFDFLNFTYDPLSYRLVEFSDTLFVVRAQWDGKEVFSKFKTIQ